ncbi:MAG: tRNA preQ1(34) S-adenosylmethionine ribosyltransferase-isomerase QueA [Candidatus Gastranaerophilales bacterium]|nr:tRNA preQ1(34) S-adenosylmethionine ribosyltransferase-isomerase QueA [Candidatus Gastranaerophilales bacterium]
MLVNEFDYNLPEELIAQMPTTARELSKMLVMNKKTGTLEHKIFADVTEYFEKDDVLILNNTKVIPARLIGYKDTGARIEVFLLKNPEGKLWECLIKPAKRAKEGSIVTFNEQLKAKVIGRLDNDKMMVELIFDGDFYKVLDNVGLTPLPPYIQRQMTDEQIKQLDHDRYQTVYAKTPGSVAAPTAGLHFTDEILNKLKNKGVQVGFVTLNVGLGTFRPVKVDNILEHKMDSESFQISEETATMITQAQKDGRRITAVGTTTVRTLETAFAKYGCIQKCHDASELFIYPGYEFKVVNRLITNFHLPKSTLLMLVSALSTRENIMNAYKEAITQKYRFYSYGDCMFIK